VTHFYVARMDVGSAFLPTFERWYDERHAPDLLKSGFLSCSAFYATEGYPLVHNVYLIPSPEIFQSPRYRDARDPKVDKLRTTVLNNVSNRSNTPYEQLLVFRCQPHDVPVPGLSMTLQFNVVGRRNLVIKRFNESFESGDTSVRLCRRDGTHINASQEPEWMIFVGGSNELNRSALMEFAARDVSDVKFQVLKHRATFVP